MHKYLEITAKQLRDLNTELGNRAAHIIERIGPTSCWSGIRKPRWTTSELRYVKKQMGKLTNSEIASDLGRTPNGVKYMVACIRRGRYGRA